VSRRVLIGQIACYGDCLYATTIARQIKHDSPDAHVTWAVAAKFRSILDHNPDIDEIWELPIHTRHIRREDWDAFHSEAESRRSRGEYTEVHYTQIIDIHIEKFLTTLRNTAFKIVGAPITVPVTPVVRLTDAEVARVAAFAEKHQLARYRHVVLFECTPSSAQSRLDVGFALELARIIAARHPDVCFILSSHESLPANSERVFDASVLSYRENAELSKHCSMLIGCSSGITWITTSDWAKRLPMLQLLNERSQIFCGVNFDHRLNGLDNSSVIEMTEYDMSRVVACVETMLTRGAQAARARFNQDYLPNRFSLEATAAVLYGRDRSIPGVLRFIDDYLEANAQLGNHIRVSRTAVLARILFARLRASPHPILRAAKWSVRRVRRSAR
jgi:hypothetical protein